jgi:hypothetical protein
VSTHAVSHLFLLLALLTESGARAAEIAATGISIPFFDDAGKLTHRMIAKSGTKSGAVQKLHGIEIHYFAPNDPSVIVQKLEAAEAIWDERAWTLVGRGLIVVATVDNRLTGDGFDFALTTSLLHIHKNLTMSNREVRLTSDRAKIELVVERGQDLKVRDVRRCEAIGNLHIVVQPTARKKYLFKEAFSDLAIYDGVDKSVEFPNPTRVLKTDGGVGHFQTFRINLRDEAEEE